MVNSLVTSLLDAASCECAQPHMGGADANHKAMLGVL
jgi:hypothetical protein